MSIEEENKVRQRRVFEEVINNGNLDLIPEYFAPDYSIISPMGIEIEGADGFKQGSVTGRIAFPDLHYSIDDMFAEGDKVATRYTMTGTFKGEYMGIAPTGKKFAITGILITRWVDGKEVEAWDCRDMLGYYQQLGVTPPSQ
jgi:predicted ester cyclase